MTEAVPAIAIRPLSTADVAGVADLYCEVFNAPPWNDAWTHDLAVRRLTDALTTPGALGLALWQGEMLLGAVIGHHEQWYDRREFYVQEMFIHADHQRHGFGARMMDHLKEMLGAQGVSAICLVTMRDSPAADFYAKHGFRASTRMALMACRLDR